MGEKIPEDRLGHKGQRYRDSAKITMDNPRVAFDTEIRSKHGEESTRFDNRVHGELAARTEQSRRLAVEDARIHLGKLERDGNGYDDPAFAIEEAKRELEKANFYLTFEQRNATKKDYADNESRIGYLRHVPPYIMQDPAATGTKEVVPPKVIKYHGLEQAPPEEMESFDKMKPFNDESAA